MTALASNDIAVQRRTGERADRPPGLRETLLESLEAMSLRELYNHALAASPSAATVRWEVVGSTVTDTKIF
jgi:hypothetical protein